MPFNKIVLNSYLTLSQIQLEKIRIVSGENKLGYDLNIQDDHLDIFSFKNGSKLEWKAELNAKWTFKVGFSTIHEGKFKADLEAKDTIFSFKFFTNYSNPSAKVTNDWKITKSDIGGHGAYREIEEKLKSMVKENLFLKINEELTKHGALLLDLMTYSRSFRKMPVKNHTEIKKTPYSYVLVNKIKKLEKPEQKNPLKIMLSGDILNEQTHKKRTLYNLSRSSISDGADIVLSFNLNTLNQVFSASFTDSFETLFFNKAKLIELFHDLFNITTLARFYPRIAEEYEPRLELELSCTLLNAKYEYTCAFFLVEDKHKRERDIVFLIDKLEWEQKLDFTCPKNASDSIIIENKANNFKSIVIESVKIDPFSARQLMFFLKPLNDHLGQISAIRLDPVSSRDNLTFHSCSLGKEYLDLQYNIAP